MIDIGRLMNLNCALLGTGRQAKRLANAISHNHSEIISLYSRKKERGNKFLKETKFTNAFVSSDLASITSDSKLDIIVIATPDFLHYEHAKIALEAGKHVYVEKPLATTVKQAQELIKISRALNRCLYVGYHFRHVSALQFINQLFSNEYFGRIYNVNIYWGIEIASLETDSHKKSTYKSGGTLVTHLIDLALWNLKPTCGNIVDFSAISYDHFFRGKDDTIHMCMEFEIGARCTVICTSGYNIPLKLEIISEKGIFCYDKILGKNQEITIDGETKKFDYIDPWVSTFADFIHLINHKKHNNPLLVDNLENINLLSKIES